MTEGILITIIGSIALIIGAIIQANINIFGFIKYFRKKTYHFSCVWQIIEPSKLARTINDTIKITIFKNRTLKGEGVVSDLGKYVIKGIDSDYCLALYYSGIKDKDNLAGVVFINKPPVFDNLEGHWKQLDKNGNILDGTVKLKRIEE